MNHMVDFQLHNFYHLEADNGRLAQLVERHVYTV